LPTAKEGGVVIAPEKAVFTGSDKRVRFDRDENAHIALAFEGASWTSEWAFPLMLMHTILGSWDRTSGGGKNVVSKLGQEVAEKELASSYMTFNTCYKDTGLFGIYGVTTDNKCEDFMWHVMSNLVRIVHKTSDEEVERAKRQLKANMLMQLDGHAHVAEDIGRQLLTYNRRMTTAEIFARIDAIDTADVKAAANKFINDNDHALAAVGPIYELPDYNWIRRRSYWLRY
jgi:processing peptidase subunit beta